MNTARGRLILCTALLVFGFALVHCSKSGDPGVAPAQDTASPAAAVESPADAAQAGSSPPPAPPAEEEPTTAQEFRPETAVGAVEGIPAPTNTAPIVAVANYFTELPGFDVAGLKPRQREKFLQQVNSEMCTCGCKNDTLARCYINDPRCPMVKGMVQKVYDEVKAGR
ncbi:MAG: hypothetical protein HY510_06940 [Acidobacteria bacterium]|nr:hypothetical protein [Acidobacteriota bacterium]